MKFDNFISFHWSKNKTKNDGQKVIKLWCWQLVKSQSARTHTHTADIGRDGGVCTSLIHKQIILTLERIDRTYRIELNRSKSQMSNQLHEYFIVHRVAHSSTLHNLLAIPALSISVSFTSIGSTEHRETGKEKERASHFVLFDTSESRSMAHAWQNVSSVNLFRATTLFISH